MIDWQSGYASEWRVMRVDPQSWGNAEELEGILSVKINRDCTDDYPLLESASISCDIAVTDEFEEGWYRIEMLARQHTDVQRFQIATLLLQSSSGVIDRGLKTASIDGYSVLQPAADMLLPSGMYVPKGINAATYVEGLLEKCTPAPVVVESEFKLNDYYVFPLGTSYIEAIWTILDAGNFVMQIDGDGTINILPKPSVPELALSEVNAAFIEPSVDYEIDLSGIPNRYFVYYGDKSYVEVNNQKTSNTSVAARGRYIDYIDTDPVMANGESIETYARRRLVEESTVLKKYSYNRQYIPGLYPFDIIEGSIERVDLLGNLRILGQTLECGKGILVTEKVGLEVLEYDA